MDTERTEAPLKGRLHFHSETGTEGGFWAFQDDRFISPPAEPGGTERWSYEGLHILKDGDRLRILSPDSEGVVWDGTISLIEYPVFTQDAFGFWIHSDQVGVDRLEWAKRFLDGLPAELISK